MRTRTRRSTRVRRVVAWLALTSIAALLLLPALAYAAGNLVSSYDLPGSWNVVSDDEDSFSANAEYGNVDDWGGEATVSAKIMTPENPYTGQPEEHYYSSFEDFAARSGGSVTIYGSADEVAVQVDYVWTGAQRTTLGGLEAWSNIGVYKDYTAPGWFQTEYQYWIPTGDGGIYVSAGGTIASDETDANFNIMANDIESILASLRFNAPGATAGPAVPGGDGDTSPWRTVTGGAAALAAAAVALAGAMASARAKTGAEEPAPDQTVGYLLQLSTRRLTVSAEHSATFTSQAFKVLANGTYQPASDAAIILHPPAGVSVQPQTAYGTLSTVVWQNGEIALGSAITVEAQASLGATTAAVTVAAAGTSRIVTRVEPTGTLALRTQGDHSVTLVAAVELLGADATDAALDPAAIRASITFAEDSEWLEISAPADYEDGRAITVMASQPDPTSPVQPPESATVRVDAWIGERPLTELVAIPLAGLPEIDAKPDEVSFAAESGSVAEVAITITNAGDTPWQFDTVWREGSRAIASATTEPTGPSAATLTLTEDGGDNLDATRPQTASTLVVVATADGYEELRRHVNVIVTQEGLFIDRTNADPATGAFPLAADGSARPTEVDLRVFVRDPATGEIAPDIALAEQAALEIGGQEGTSGHAGLMAGGLAIEPAGVRQLNIPSATFSVSLERKLPTAGEPVPAALLASVPGYDTDRFSALVPLRLLGVDMEPYSDAWETERDKCLDIIREFVPHEYQDRFYTLIQERSLTMGAEGLFYMRKQIWSFAYDQLMIEKHEHLDAAWWYEQVENTLEWVSWCGDIAMGVLSGTALGVVGGMALGMLKPLLVSAMEVWLAGGSLEDWLTAQSGMLTGFIEGALTDPDFLTKLSGDKKAIGWALFIAYYFAKELYNDPNLSVTNAAKNVARQLRDEGLIRFLQMIAGMKGGAPKKAKAGADAGTPDAPHAKAGTDAPDATRPKTGGPDADAPRARTEAGVPEAPATKSATDTSAPEGAAPKSPDADAARTRDASVETGRAGDGDATADATKRTTPEAEAADTSGETDARTAHEADARKPADADTKQQKPTDADATPQKKPDADATAEKSASEKTPEQVAEKAPDADVDPRTSDPDPEVRAEGIADDIKRKAGVFGELDPETVERIMRDPDAMRELRKTHPDLWKKVTSTRAKIYQAHDAQLRSWIENNVPEAKGREVEIRTVGTADGVDRDYRAGYVTTDPVTGQQSFVELKKEKWVPESQRIFAKETGGPTDAKGAAKWAKDHQQLGTDQYHAEASPDMADQRKVWNEQTKKFETQQVTPNIDLVKRGEATLIDPDAYGKTYETKVIESYAEGNTLDAYKQASKATHSLEGVREGYSMQGYEVDHLPPEMRTGMQIVDDVNAGRIKVPEAEAQLRLAGYTGGLPDFMEKISGQFAGFKWARKA